MVNSDYENHSWLAFDKLNQEELQVLLKYVTIDRYALGGPEHANKGILEIVKCSGNFWDKFVLHGGKLRLGCNKEGVLSSKELTIQDLFKIPLDKLIEEL